MLVEVANCQTIHNVDGARLKQAVEVVLTGEKIADAVVSVAVVDDRSIHELNRRHLQHDYPTDVLSFLFDHEHDRLEGEIVVSADTAAEQARRYQSEFADELLLYVVHGTLHLSGYDDCTPAERRSMRRLERRYLSQLGVTPRWRGR